MRFGPSSASMNCANPEDPLMLKTSCGCVLAAVCRAASVASVCSLKSSKNMLTASSSSESSGVRSPSDASHWLDS
eukprot:14112392-Heterocapsa_arctica.AAC.1